MRAIQVEQFGGPEVLQLVDLPAPVPGDGEVLIEVSSAGVNYADTHQTENSYLARQRLPMIPGGEVIGRTPTGERVLGFTSTGTGGYAEQAVLNKAMAVPVSDDISDGAALSLLVQGLTAWHLLRTVGHMTANDTVVVNAAAGGVGSLAVQLAKLWGAKRVIALASSSNKRELALSLGADVALDSTAGDLKAQLRGANEGRGVDLVLEMAGGAAGDELLSSLGAFGRFITYGMASREPMQPVQPASLMVGSHTISGFWLMDCMKPHVAAAMVAVPLSELLSLVAAGDLTPVAGSAFPLERAADAHRALLARQTVGKVVLTMN